MGARRWTEEELQKLDELSDRYTANEIAKKLGRSFNAVNIKLNRCRIGGFLVNTELLTFNQISKIMGVDWKTVSGTWIRHGLKTKRHGNFRTASQVELLRFLRQNQDKWNAAKVTDDAIFYGQKWYEEKRSCDRVRKRRWSEDEVSRLKARYRKGVPFQKIADELGRSEKAARCKMQILRDNGFRI